MGFRDQIKERRWLVTGDGQTTHLLMDGTGKLCVPDTHAGTFLNMYFAAVAVCRETLSVVEQRTPVFRLFFDLDIRLRDEDTVHADTVIRKIVTIVWKFVTTRFFVMETGSSGPDVASVVSSTMDDSSTATTDARDRMIVCTAPPKKEQTGLQKTGVHLIFPNIFVNSPIALRCREALVEHLEAVYYETGCVDQSNSSQSVTQGDSMADSMKDSAEPGPVVGPANSWRDIIDDTVYKGSGLRLIYSHKGRSEGRAYVPVYDMDRVQGMYAVNLESLATRRAYIHDCSIRSVHSSLTPCQGGEHQIADSLDSHMMGGTTVSGRTQSLDMYKDALPVVAKALPSAYTGIRFLKAFVTDHTVYLKTNSRYCMNVKREHRTSTVYVAITRHGAMVRCYSRKDEYGCATFATDVIPLPPSTIKVFFPDSVKIKTEPSDGAQKEVPICFTSAKRRRATVHSILHTNPLFRKPTVKKKR